MANAVVNGFVALIIISIMLLSGLIGGGILSVSATMGGILCGLLFPIILIAFSSIFIGDCTIQINYIPCNV